MEHAMIDLQLLVSAMERSLVLSKESEKELIERGTQYWERIRAIRTETVKRTPDTDLLIARMKNHVK